MNRLRHHRILLTTLIIINAFIFPLSGKNTYNLVIINAGGKQVPLNVEIADTEPMRMKGLMDRKEMRRDSGMLFVFDREEKLNFWMKNTYIPLSIAYISKTGVINEIRDMKPLDTSMTYPSAIPARYALEVNRGWFEENNITKGCRIALDGCISK
jgi:uncharacterized protein